MLDRWLVDIYSIFLFFHFVNSGFWSTNIFNLDVVQFILLLLLLMLLVSYLRIHCPVQGPEYLLLCFILEFYSFSSYIWVFDL